MHWEFVITIPFLGSCQYTNIVYWLHLLQVKNVFRLTRTYTELPLQKPPCRVLFFYLIHILQEQRVTNIVPFKYEQITTITKLSTVSQTKALMNLPNPNINTSKWWWQFYNSQYKIASNKGKFELICHSRRCTKMKKWMWNKCTHCISSITSNSHLQSNCANISLANTIVAATGATSARDRRWI